MSMRPLISTYRLQLNASFTLHDARERVPYLHRLGISHLYLSPVLAARRGSTHGYDVADPTHVSLELGGDAALVALADEAHAHEMGLVLDIVPNHMGIGPDNPYWDDLLERGSQSRFASWFDVEWRAPTRRLIGKVLLPVLGDSLERAIARDELTLEVSDLGVRVRYFDHSFPVDPTTLPPELELAMRDPTAREVVRDWTSGPEGQARLQELLVHQHYELAFWRSAQRDLNYRRFFDVNELISLRVENREVFEATHRAVLQFVADGIVDGLRVDHIDGLLEPRRYLERLRAAVDERRPAAGADARIPIVVEKILAAGEGLPADWPVDGTTGYEIMTALEDLFIDPVGYDTLESRYRGRLGTPDFHAVAVDSKRRVLRSALNADVRRIAPMLAAVARRASWEHRSIGAYAGAIVELVAVLPVYRTYIDSGHVNASPADRAVLERAFAQLRARGHADAVATEALERTLLGEWRDAEQEVARARLSFVLRWQQLTGPAAAKGVEDTALYVYAPLASRNEVGGDPGVPVAGAINRMNERFSERASRHPGSLNATNTHDTKRSADVRARLDALSEHVTGWERRLRRWRRHHRSLQSVVAGRLAPSRATDNFIYQALVGLWPIGSGVRATDDDRWIGELRERLTAYIQKAVREAKVSTSWTDPDAEYERAIERYIAGMLDRASNAQFLHDVEQFVTSLAPQGRWNALGRVVVHLTAPGVPDLYQGDELWFRALVDPDNRRPVDWAKRTHALDAIQNDNVSRLADWCARPEDDVLKLYITARLLHFRREHGVMMAGGSFEPLVFHGPHAGRLYGFRRTFGDDELVVIIARLTSGLGGSAPVGAAWGSTTVDVPAAVAGRAWRCELGGQVVPSHDGSLMVAVAMAILPMAVLTARRSAD
ncbi:MAG: malto-oligosyltrehalose synthase [Gemmatimonadota bacterium]|nr:malto-oligosyltrehalose synthase [Gemmatimonadota bacterium]